MPKTDIKKILKKGASTKFNKVDYNSPKKRKELLKLQKDLVRQYPHLYSLGERHRILNKKA